MRKASPSDLQTIHELSSSGDPRSNLGTIIPLNQASEGLSCQKDEFWTNMIRPYGDQFIIHWDGIFKIMDPKECKILGELINLQDLGFNSESSQGIYGFSVNPQTDFLVFSNEDSKLGTINLFRVNLRTKEIHDYRRFGINPSISPDGKEVAYLSKDGIRIMDIDGNEILKVSGSLPWDYWDHSWTKPEWSPDGTRLLYSQCPDNGDSSYLCAEYGQYHVYLFDIKTGIENKLFDSATNPSWIK